MFSGKKPSAFLFPHLIDRYSPVFDKSGGAFSRLFAATPDTADIKCFVQPAPAEVVEQYAQLNKTATHVVFIQNKSDYTAIQDQDRLVFNGRNMKVTGGHNTLELDRVFSVVVALEVT